MKKKLLIFITALCCTLATKAQTSRPIFTIGDSILSSKGLVTPLYWDYQNTPYTLYKAFDIKSSNGQYAYKVKLSNYNGTEGDGGFFRIIDIIQNDKLLVRIPQSDGWDTLRHIRDYATNNYFLTVPLNETTTALIFIGYPYQSDPPLLTIVVLYKDQAKLVFNKNLIATKVQKTNDTFIMTLHNSVIEHIYGNQPANSTDIWKIWKENGTLIFGGPYGTTTEQF